MSCGRSLQWFGFDYWGDWVGTHLAGNIGIILLATVQALYQDKNLGNLKAEAAAAAAAAASPKPSAAGAPGGTGLGLGLGLGKDSPKSSLKQPLLASDFGTGAAAGPAADVRSADGERRMHLQSSEGSGLHVPPRSSLSGPAASPKEAVESKRSPSSRASATSHASAASSTGSSGGSGSVSKDSVAGEPAPEGSAASGLRAACAGFCHVFPHLLRDLVWRLAVFCSHLFQVHQRALARIASFFLFFHSDLWLGVLCSTTGCRCRWCCCW